MKSGSIRAVAVLPMCGAMLFLSAGVSLGQPWPSWGDELFGRRFFDEPHRFERRPRDFERGSREFERRRNSTSAHMGGDVRDGGSRPAIAAIAPATVAFPYSFAPNSIVIDVGKRKLYYVLTDSRAYAYPIGVGREGFDWTGTESVSRKQAWPDWHPPPEMRERDPSLPEKMTGGLKNPLGAMALYLGNTLYRIHGTNDAKSVGRGESSGCFRMLNSAVLHLASITEVGTPVTVVSALPHAQVSRAPAPQPPTAPAEPRAPPPAPPVADSTVSPVRVPDYRSLRDQMLKTQ